LEIAGDNVAKYERQYLEEYAALVLIAKRSTYYTTSGQMHSPLETTDARKLEFAKENVMPV